MAIDLWCSIQYGKILLRNIDQGWSAQLLNLFKCLFPGVFLILHQDYVLSMLKLGEKYRYDVGGADQ